MTTNYININLLRLKNLIIFCLFFTPITLQISAQSTISYVESEELFANPERGLQKYSITNDRYNTQSNYSSLSVSTLRNWRNSSDKVTVIFRYFLLSNFVDGSAISERYLNNIERDFDIIRQAGLKCLVRFSYSNGITANAQQPTKAQILSHINQLAPILNNNKDVILTHQAGFLGTWGEWYYTRSTEFGDEGSMNNTQWNNRKEIIDAMLAATPAEIPLQVRYPQIKKKMYGNSQLTATTAYQNTANARIGFFNDAFLNTWGDMGTFSVSNQNQNPFGTTDYTYLANETKYTPMTGETNGLNAPRTDASNAMLEMNATHWTCINRDYHGSVWNNWLSTENAYNEILKHLGYRFVLKKSSFNLSDKNLNVQIELENSGYARLFKQRSLYLVLINTETNEEIKLQFDTDPRTWEGEITLNQTFDLDALSDGTYETYLSLPDPNESLADRAEYAIQFANELIWVEEKGYNRLNQPIQLGEITGNELQKVEHIQLSFSKSGQQVSIHSNRDVEDAQLSIYNLSGNTIIDKARFSERVFSLNTADFLPGFYLVLLETDNWRLTNNLLIN